MQTSPKLALPLAALSLLGLAAASPAVAQTAVYNFQVESPNGGPGSTGTTYTGAGVLAGSGSGTTSVFNALSQKTGPYIFTNAKDSNGNSSSVGLTVTADSGFSGNQSSTSTDPRALLGSFVVTQNNGKGQITLTGLTANSAFDLVLFGINGGYNDRTTKFALTDSTFTALPGTGSTMTTTGGQDNTFNNPQNYVEFTGTTTAQGLVYATYTGGNTSDGNFSGLQIGVTAAPEPSQSAALGLGALGLAGLALKARRRRGNA